MLDMWSSLIFLFVKLTFMLLFLQIFRPNRWLRYSCYFGIGIMTLVYLAFWLTQVYLTSPSPKQSWQELVRTPRYFKWLNIGIPIGAASLVFDVYILLLPIAGVMQLQMSLRRKLETSAMFASGFAYLSPNFVRLDVWTDSTLRVGQWSPRLYHCSIESG